MYLCLVSHILKILNLIVNILHMYEVLYKKAQENEIKAKEYGDQV